MARILAEFFCIHCMGVAISGFVSVLDVDRIDKCWGVGIYRINEFMLSISQCESIGVLEQSLLGGRVASLSVDLCSCTVNTKKR